MDEIGEGAAFGTNINIPLPPGSGEGTYLAAFDRIVLPALRAFRPDTIFVPSGFDAGGHDPLARMMLTSESFRRMTELLMEAADNMCRGRIVMLHEGGYAPHIVPFMALAVFEALSGETTEVADPFLPALAGKPLAGPPAPSGPRHRCGRASGVGGAAGKVRGVRFTPPAVMSTGRTAPFPSFRPKPPGGRRSGGISSQDSDACSSDRAEIRPPASLGRDDV